MEVDAISNRKGKTLVIENYLFELNKTTAQGKKYWRCEVKQCPAKVTTENEEISGGVRNTHNHAADVIKLVQKKFNAILKTKTRNSITAPAKKIHMEAKLELLGNPNRLNRDDILAGVKPLHQTKDVIRKAKKALMPTEPKNRSEIEISGNWIHTIKGEQFVIADDSNGERILLFATDDNMKALRNANVVYMDGTFKCVPKIFNQLYTLHVFVRGIMVPVVYGLLPDRTVGTYVRMFRLLQQYCSDQNSVFAPQLFQIDYEVSVIKAIEEVFGGDKVRGCLFHFAQCIWRKVQQCGLMVGYNNNIEISRLIRRLLSLPLIPMSELDNVWMEIHSEAPNTAAVVNLMDYVVKRWIDETALFNRNLWNHYGNYGPRTTNHLEGWHSAFNKKFNGPHPTFFRFLVAVKEEQDRFENDVESRAFGHPVATPRKEIRDRNKRIMDLKEQATNGEISWLDFAGACGYLLPSQQL